MTAHMGGQSSTACRMPSDGPGRSVVETFSPGMSGRFLLSIGMAKLFTKGRCANEDGRKRNIGIYH